MSRRDILGGFQASSRSKRGATPRRLRERRDLTMEGLGGRQLMAVAISPDIYVALEGDPLTVASPGALGNDTSTTDSAITVTHFTQPTDGTLTLNQDGAFGSRRPAPRRRSGHSRPTPRSPRARGPSAPATPWPTP